MKCLVQSVLWSVIVVSLGGCAPDNAAETLVAGRWYTHGQVGRGKRLFGLHCAACHGDRGQGLAADWRRADADGNYPAPPLNGSAHTWHHPTDVLLRTIENGGTPFGGVMPAFGQDIEQHQALEVIAYIQSLWDDDVYARWLEIEAR